MDPVDAAWWRMDSPTNRMTIVAVLRFDGTFTADEFTALLAERLAPFDRFRLRVRAKGGRPHWEEDPDFAFSRQVVTQTENPPTDDAELKLLVGEMMSAPLAADRPPWQFLVVERFGEGSVVIGRLHHAIADGLALVHVLKSLADGAEASGTASLVAMPKAEDAEMDESEEEFDEPMAARRLRLRDLIGWFKRLPRLSIALLKFALTGRDKKSRFRGRQGEEKRVDWSSGLDLKTLRRAAISHSATINDVLLAVLAGGLRRYLEHYRTMAESFELRAIIPVNLRHRHEELGLGNRFGLVILALPVGLRNLASRVKEVHLRMLEARQSMEPVAAFGLLSTLGRGPGFLENVAVKRLSATSSAAITHVPGPRKHLILAGRTLSEIMFWVPRGGSVGMGISIMTYAGTARIGLATDAGLIPDPDALARGIAAELGDLGL
jgi:diacylglycerol O-acyltransferase